MIRVKVTKNIMNKVGVIFNLNIRQLIWLGAGEVSIIAGIGVIRINEMNLFVFLIKLLKGADKRPYSNTKGVYDKDEFSVF